MVAANVAGDAAAADVTADAAAPGVRVITVAAVAAGLAASAAIMTVTSLIYE